MIKQYELTLPEQKPGFHIIDQYIKEAVKEWPEQGLCNIFIKHTSAALAINEGADPSVRLDLQTIFDRLAPESRQYIHNDEGPDDMPAHAKAILAGCSLTIPIQGHKLAFGTWQSVYMCEFRNRGGRRKLLITIYS